jgi:hypothetical protein
VYTASDQIKQSATGRTCSTHGINGNICKNLVGKREGKRPLGSHKWMWEDNIKIYLEGTGCENVEWFNMA